MVRLQLNARQPAPKECMMPDCGYHFLDARTVVVIPWLIEGEPRFYGRVLWYLYVCHNCYWKLPEKVRKRAIEPPKQAPEHAERSRWHEYLPIARDHTRVRRAG